MAFVPCLQVQHPPLHFANGSVHSFYALVVAFSVVTVILLITEIVLFARKRLLPKTFFAFQLTNFLLWTVLFAMAIAGIVIGYDSILIIVSVVIAWLVSVFHICGRVKMLTIESGSA